MLLEPELGNKRCHGHRKPALHNQEQPPLSATGENLRTAAKTQLGHQSVIKNHSWFLCRRARPAWRRRWRLLAPWRAWAARTQGSGQCSAPDGSRDAVPKARPQRAPKRLPTRDANLLEARGTVTGPW